MHNCRTTIYFIWPNEWKFKKVKTAIGITLNIQLRVLVRKREQENVRESKRTREWERERKIQQQVCFNIFGELNSFLVTKLSTLFLHHGDQFLAPFLVDESFDGRRHDVDDGEAGGAQEEAQEASEVGKEVVQVIDEHPLCHLDFRRCKEVRHLDNTVGCSYSQNRSGRHGFFI